MPAWLKIMTVREAERTERSSGSQKDMLARKWMWGTRGGVDGDELGTERKEGPRMR